MVRRRTRALAPGDIACTSLPLMRTAPEVGSSSVPAIVSSEDLPDPDGPMTATISPAATVRDTSRSACTSAAAVDLGDGAQLENGHRRTPILGLVGSPAPARQAVIAWAGVQPSARARR